MKLLVDVGNSRVKWAFVEAGEWVAHGEALRDAADGLHSLLESPLTPDEIRLANVAGAGAGSAISAQLRERFQLTPVLARSAATGAGVRNGYTNPEQLGVDRWLAICAAYSQCRGAVCVVDAGTATTIDLVAGDGEHQGGLILAGIDLMESALLSRTGDLARLAQSIAAAPATGDLVLARDTTAAIRFGALQATASLIWGCISSFEAKLRAGAAAPALLVTGGAARSLQPVLIRPALAAGGESRAQPEYRPDLVLEGLNLEPPCFASV